MRVFAYSCGWITGALSGFFAGGEGTIRVPVPSFLIEHPKGRVVFDAGMHPQAGTDPEARLGVLSQFFDIEMGAGEDVASRLASLDVDASRVDHLILSHLHFDHAGGAALLPNANLLVQRREWEAGAEDETAMRCGFAAHDYRLGHNLKLVDGEHDLFGDGRVVCLPTHGHTPGHQSLRLRLDDGREVILCADACYLCRNMDEMTLPGTVYDADTMMVSLQKLESLRRAGATMIYGHDPQAWGALPQAPRDFAASSA